jgi:hypothetical protein
MRNKATTTQARQMPAVLLAIPLSKDLKRYYWKKYELLRRENGPLYAARVFSDLRTQIMRLRQHGGHILTNWDLIKKESWPVRKNGWLFRLCQSAAAQPLAVFQFLKVYTTEVEPLVTPYESAEAQAKELSEALPGPTPIVLLAWCRLISYPFGVWRKEHRLFTEGTVDRSSHVIFYHDERYLVPGDDYEDFLAKKGIILDEKSSAVIRQMLSILRRRVFPRLSSEKGIQDLAGYWKRWRNALLMEEPTLEQSTAMIRRALPSDVDYADTRKGQKRNAERMSGQMSLDINDLLILNAHHSERMGDFWMAIPDVLQESLEDFWAYERVPSRLRYESTDDPHTWAGCVFAGNIHHIPKKGTVKRRAIAAPNKFFQAMMAPCQKALRSVTGRLPRNAQFQQTRFNEQIQEAVDAGSASCWDLHQATDWLPLAWFEDIVQELKWFQENTPARRSYDWYLAFSRANWENEAWGLESRWLRGQPLGTWPSFEVLTITHHLLLEALAFRAGRLDSPYAICGDDNVIWSDKLSRNYILSMRKGGCPISEHKSFSGGLVEFAGQVFVKNNQALYTPSQYPVYLTNLFDYQRVAGRALRWRDLPKKVREQFTSCCVKHNEQANPRLVYQAIQFWLDVPTPKISDEIGNLIANMCLNELEHRDQPKDDVLREQHWHQWEGGVLTFADSLRVNPGSSATMHRSPDTWFRRKYRPESARTLIEWACKPYLSSCSA